MQTIKDLQVQKGNKILLRLDLNVPVSKKGKITNSFRITESVPTIQFLQKVGCKVLIIAHKESGSLSLVAKHLQKKLKKFKFLDLPKKVEAWNPAYLKKIEEMNSKMKDGDVLLLENLRMNEGEKENDIDFSKYLVSLIGENGFYINEAFSASHRSHASIVGVPKVLGKDKCAIGPKFVKEVNSLQSSLKAPKPMMLILGGAKFDTKLKLLEKFLPTADHVFVGGALAHNFWKNQGLEIGNSLSDDETKLSKSILTSEKIFLPVDVVLENKKQKAFNEIEKGEKVVDFGKNTLQEILKIARTCNTIIWNGPLGYYEGGFDWGTKNLLISLGMMKNKTIVLGGGDTVAVAEKVLKKNRNLVFTHISTGGGAMIDFLSNGTLPGLDVLR
jgi:phosphoglycerate kinase